MPTNRHRTHDPVDQSFYDAIKIDFSLNAWYILADK